MPAPPLSCKLMIFTKNESRSDFIYSRIKLDIQLNTTNKKKKNKSLFILGCYTYLE